MLCNQGRSHGSMRPAPPGWPPVIIQASPSRSSATPQPCAALLPPLQEAGAGGRLPAAPAIPSGTRVCGAGGSTAGGCPFWYRRWGQHCRWVPILVGWSGRVGTGGSARLPQGRCGRHLPPVRSAAVCFLRGACPLPCSFAPPLHSLHSLVWIVKCVCGYQKPRQPWLFCCQLTLQPPAAGIRQPPSLAAARVPCLPRAWAGRLGRGVLPEKTTTHIPCLVYGRRATWGCTVLLPSWDDIVPWAPTLGVCRMAGCRLRQCTAGWGLTSISLSTRPSWRITWNSPATW